MPPHTKTNKDLQAQSISQEAALQRHQLPLRLESTNRNSTTFLFGSHETLLDTACEFLSPDLRPVPPQPNCPQSMKIYEEHRQMAAEFLRVQTELAELRQYKAQLQEKVKQNMVNPAQEEINQFTQLKSEKDALIAFRGKLEEQLSLIEAAQNKKSGSAHSTGGSTDGWVVVNSKPPEKNS